MNRPRPVVPSETRSDGLCVRFHFSFVPHAGDRPAKGKTTMFRILMLLALASVLAVGGRYATAAPTADGGCECGENCACDAEKCCGDDSCSCTAGKCCGECDTAKAGGCSCGGDCACDADTCCGDDSCSCTDGKCCGECDKDGDAEDAA